MRKSRHFVVLATAVAAIVLLHVSPTAARHDSDSSRHNTRNRPVELRFVKWNAPSPVLTGIARGDIAGTFVGEVLQSQHSTNGLVNPNPDPTVDPLNLALNGIVRLEAFYGVEADDDDESFSAIVRGGQDQVTGRARLSGVVLAGWRSGAAVEVAYQRYFAGDRHCTDAGALVTVNCFAGTIHIERAPRD